VYRLRATGPVLDHAWVDESAGWDDPAELQIRLDIALEQIAELTAQNAQLRQRLNLPPCDAAPDASPPPAEKTVQANPQVPLDSDLPYADASSSPQDKIALFRALFAGRTDVYLSL
jgi:hypothetical protein